ncbi:thioredoxin-like protein [Ochromonadaceae sp. CCMP2298]|nr:thioredoxin-like protein [Ochromonadaceae sp. CCMP2298]
MQGTGKTYEVTGNTTEWDDILIKKGIRTYEEILLEKGLNPEDFVKKEEAAPEVFLSTEEALLDLDLDELDELDEDNEFADSRMINAYRQQRLNELKEAAFKSRFGEVVDIVKNDWVREVTEGSNHCTVIVHLYEDCITECQVMDEALRQLAPKFKYLKILRIKASQAIEKWPEMNLPTLFVYEGGSLKTQVLTLGELDGKSTKAADVEWLLAQKGIITDSELDENPKYSRKTTSRSHAKLSSTVFRTTGLDSDDDLDLDDED